MLANSASPALWFLAALASPAAEFQSPVERVVRIPQKPRYCLDKAPSSTQILILMGDICTRATWLLKSFAERQTRLCGALPAHFISPGPWSPAHTFLESLTTQSDRTCSQNPDCLQVHHLPKCLALIPDNAPQYVCTLLPPKATESIYLQGF